MKKMWTVGFALILIALIAAGTVQASPFIVSGPYPLEANLTDTDPPLPENFVVVLDNGAPVTVAPTLNATGQIYLKYDLVSVNKGKHTIKVKATHSIWGESAEVPFTFRSGSPVVPPSVGLSKQ